MTAVTVSYAKMKCINITDVLDAVTVKAATTVSFANVQDPKLTISIFAAKSIAITRATMEYIVQKPIVSMLAATKSLTKKTLVDA